MARDGISFFKAPRNMQGLMTVLTSAACEWFLIFLLLIDSTLSYLLTRFACYCELPLPCMLCSRLDHVLGNEKPQFYRNLLCSDHRVEISSLIPCYMHGKLADGFDMCDDCLLSFCKDYSFNPGDMQRLLIGKFQSTLLNKDTNAIPASKMCSCCNKPWKSKQNVEKLHQMKSTGIKVTKPNVPLPRRLTRRNNLKKTRDKSPGPGVTSRCIDKAGLDILSHVGYSELKITSDSDSELLISDDEVGSGLIPNIGEAKNGVKPCDLSSWHGLAELNWQKFGPKITTSQKTDRTTYASSWPELISLADIPPSNYSEMLHGESPISQSRNTSVATDPVSLVGMNQSDVNQSSDSVEALIGASQEKSFGSRTTEAQQVPINHHEEILELLYKTAEAGSKDMVVAPENPTCGDPSDIGDIKKETPIVIAEPSIEKEQDRDIDRKIHPSIKDTNSSMQIQDDEFQRRGASENSGVKTINEKSDLVERNEPADDIPTDASTSDGVQIHQKSDSVDRIESVGVESLDGSTVSEIDGEPTIDRLKRQVEYDRKCMNALYKELDAERSASAIAANQAMAMITKLQEEKAALHMEALQYLRMMEEQAEYDVEELQKANDLLADKEKELQDLEAELEYYRLRFGDETKDGISIVSPENSNARKENVKSDYVSSNQIKDEANIPCDASAITTSLQSELEDEKFYILQSLKSLERKLHDEQDFLDEEGNLTNSNREEMRSSSEKDRTVSDSNHPTDEGTSGSNCKEQVICKENNQLVSNEEKASIQSRKVDVVALQNEISDLNDRLEALEDSCNFIEHSFNFLQNGNEGMQFINDIAHQLQEIRKVCKRSKSFSVP